MGSFKHYSFDLWFTLIKSNPEFKKERAKYFHDNFNFNNKTLIDVETIFRSVDLMCNAINEKTGKNISAEEMYLMVLYQINEDHKYIDNINLQELYTEMEKMFFNYPPKIFNFQTIEVLHSIKQLKNTTNILSNTAFIKGSSLRQITKYLGLDLYLDFQIYSDEVDLSKPNGKIYDLLIENIISLKKDTKIGLNEIIHIGDNPISDIKGAENKGIRAFQINSNQFSIVNIIE
jgi:putative hydrolase of the HAD superfamily